MAATSPLSPRLQSLFDRKHASSGEIDALLPEDVEELRAIALGHRSMPRAIRLRALAVLQTLVPPGLENVLSSLLDDPREDVALRASAAAGLARLPAEMAEPLLLRALGADAAEIRIRAVRALAQIGGEAALSALRGLSSPEREIAATIRFARAVIAFRLGRTDEEMPWITPIDRPPSELPGPVPISVDALDGRELSRHLAETTGPRFSLDLSDKLGFQITCRGLVPYLIFFSREFVADPQGFLRRPGLVGLVAKHAVDLDRYAVDHVLLAAPNEGRVRAGSYHTHGDLQYAGVGQPATDGGFDFTLSDTPGHGRIPLHLVVRVDGRGVQFQQASAGAELRAISVERVQF